MAWPTVTYRWTDLEGGSWLSQTVAVTWTDGAVIDFTALTGAGSTFAEVEADVIPNKATVESGSDFWAPLDGSVGIPIKIASLGAGSGENENNVLTMVGAGSGVVVVRQAEVGHTHTTPPLTATFNLGTYATGFTFGSVVTTTAVTDVSGTENPAERAAATNQTQLDPADVSPTQDTAINPPYQSPITDTDKGVIG